MGIVQTIILTMTLFLSPIVKLIAFRFWQRYALYLQYKKTGANLDAYVGACHNSIPIDVNCWPIVDLDSLGSVTLALYRSNSFSDSEPLARLES